METASGISEEARKVSHALPAGPRPAGMLHFPGRGSFLARFPIRRLDYRAGRWKRPQFFSWRRRIIELFA